MIKITLPDGSVKKFENGSTPFDVAMSISSGLARAVYFQQNSTMKPLKQ